MVIFFTILEQSRFILSFLFVGQAGWVRIIICITCNQPHIFFATALKSPTLWFTRWALFAMKWAAIAFSLDRSEFLLNCWLWFQQTQTLPKHFQLDLHKCHNSFFIYPSEKWFAMYFELTLSTISCNYFIVKILTCDWLIQNLSQIFVWVASVHV